MPIKFIIALIFAAAVVLSACGNRPVLTNNSGISFYSQLPVAVSSIWDDGTDTFITPSRKNRITDVFTLNGSLLNITPTGSYYKVPGIHSSLMVTVNGERFIAKK
jgi:hypothetical protein